MAQVFPSSNKKLSQNPSLTHFWLFFGSLGTFSTLAWHSGPEGLWRPFWRLFEGDFGPRGLRGTCTWWFQSYLKSCLRLGFFSYSWPLLLTVIWFALFHLRSKFGLVFFAYGGKSVFDQGFSVNSQIPVGDHIWEYASKFRILACKVQILSAIPSRLVS